MPRDYVVEQGDDLIGIAGRFGFADTKKIEDANADLMKKRARGLLYPGDAIQVPDLTVTKLDGSAKKSNKYKLTSPTRKLKIPIQDGQGKALADEKYTMGFSDERYLPRQGTTDSSGIIELEVSWKETEVVLALGERSVIKLRIGHLNPLLNTDDGSASGVAQRLALLGYHPGALDGSEDTLIETAIRAFQRDQALEETGEADSATLKKLDEVATAAMEKGKGGGDG
jgi:peptidoglycan hydrolase-like protein with peptidoglycan-binding domain